MADFQAPPGWTPVKESPKTGFKPPPGWTPVDTSTRPGEQAPKMVMKSQPAPSGAARQAALQGYDAPKPDETWEQYAKDPEHPMWKRLGAALGIEGRQIYEGVKSVMALPGDVATGKTTMED